MNTMYAVDHPSLRQLNEPPTPTIAGAKGSLTLVQHIAPIQYPDHLGTLKITKKETPLRRLSRIGKTLVPINLHIAQMITAIKKTSAIPFTSEQKIFCLGTQWKDEAGLIWTPVLVYKDPDGWHLTYDTANWSAPKNAYVGTGKIARTK
tara:strand:+ start:98 stop:544 length:447 start_codon:yes stop_codon:yes gene_type:complete